MMKAKLIVLKHKALLILPLLALIAFSIGFTARQGRLPASDSESATKTKSEPTKIQEITNSERPSATISKKDKAAGTQTPSVKTPKKDATYRVAKYDQNSVLVGNLGSEKYWIIDFKSAKISKINATRSLKRELRAAEDAYNVNTTDLAKVVVVGLSKKRAPASAPVSYNEKKLTEALKEMGEEHPEFHQKLERVVLEKI